MNKEDARIVHLFNYWLTLLCGYILPMHYLNTLLFYSDAMGWKETKRPKKRLKDSQTGTQVVNVGQ